MKRVLSYILPSFIVGICLIIAAYIIGDVAKRFADDRRIVSVKGLSEREFEADRVVWPIQYKLVGNDLAILHKDIEKKTKLIRDFLVSNGLESSEIDISPSNIRDLEADIYISDKSKYRYIATNILTVTSSNVQKVRELIGRQIELLNKGVVISNEGYPYVTEYFFTKLNDIKAEMVEEAAANARKSAEQFANDSKSTLGKIKDARQGQVIIENRDTNTPYIKRVRVVTSISYFLKD